MGISEARFPLIIAPLGALPSGPHLTTRSQVCAVGDPDSAIIAVAVKLIGLAYPPAGLPVDTLSSRTLGMTPTIQARFAFGNLELDAHS